jgi:hypothetical protein
MKEMPPSDFDWVTARNDCSMPNMLQRLRLLAKANVETRNKQELDSAGFIDADRAGNVVFSVWSKRVHGNERHAADFSISDDTKVLTVRRGGQSFTVTVTVDDFGVCKCKVGNEELDPWQVLKRALEPLLFPEG